MQIGVIGLNHKCASLEELEQALRELSLEGPRVLLSTCNRVEIYFSGHCPLLAGAYTYWGEEAFFHLARVVSGLDSAILFETEIQGQVKVAYNQAQRPLPSELHYLFQKCLKIGKDIRSSIHLCPHMASTDSAILPLVKNSPKTLLVGASKINKALIEKYQGHDLTLINRTPTLSTVPVKPWEHLAKWHTYDLVIVATKSPTYLINEVPPIDHPIVLVDLSVPRNINPNLADHPLITLTNIEMLHNSIAKKRHIDPQILNNLERVVAEKVRWQLSRWEGRTTSLVSVASR